MFVKILSNVSRSSYLHHSLAPQSQPFSIISTFLHTSSFLNSALATLRKNTGYSLSICKKALTESNNDVQQAENWLKEQAQAQGWAKAQKLQGRNTSQGLLGVMLNSQTAAMVEVNCETDFVARNQQFVSLLRQVAESCIVQHQNKSDADLSTQLLSQDQVANIASSEDGKSVGDLVALNIGQIGENMTLGQARLFFAGSDVKLAAQCHPSVSDKSDDRWHCGRYATVVAYKTSGVGSYPEDISEEMFIKQLCQHVVGMGPTHVDNPEDKENSLFHQTFLLDEEKKVGEILAEAGVTVIDFVRSEVGRSE